MIPLLALALSYYIWDLAVAAARNTPCLFDPGPSGAIYLTHREER